MASFTPSIAAFIMSIDPDADPTLPDKPRNNAPTAIKIPVIIVNVPTIPPRELLANLNKAVTGVNIFVNLPIIPFVFLNISKKGPNVPLNNLAAIFALVYATEAFFVASATAICSCTIFLIAFASISITYHLN